MGLPNSRLSNKGFSIVEMLVVISIAGVLAGVAVTSYRDMVRKHKLIQYGSKMEYMVRYARIMAMERTSNIGVCVQNNSNLTIRDIGTDRAAGPCTGTTVKAMTITSEDVSGNSITLAGSSVAFDPRGLSVCTQNVCGNACVTNNARYVKACVYQTGMRIEEGAGGCTACSP